MTREEAIKVIKSIIDVEQEYGGKDNIDALNMAISALEHICDDDCEHCTWTECPEDVVPTMIYPQVDGITPTVVAEPCEDAVSRQAVLEIVNNPLNIRLDAIIKRLPSVTVRQTGEWIIYNYPADECVYCSKCKTEYYENDLYMGGSEFPNFCPNCGADMRGENK